MLSKEYLRNSQLFSGVRELFNDLLPRRLKKKKSPNLQQLHISLG